MVSLLLVQCTTPHVAHLKILTGNQQRQPAPQLNADNSWYYQASDPTAAHTQHGMVGPSPTFYDPNAVQQADGGHSQYQPWMEYANPQQHASGYQTPQEPHQYPQQPAEQQLTYDTYTQSNTYRPQYTPEVPVNNTQHNNVQGDRYSQQSQQYNSYYSTMSTGSHTPEIDSSFSQPRQPPNGTYQVFPATAPQQPQLLGPHEQNQGSQVASNIQSGYTGSAGLFSAPLHLGTARASNNPSTTSLPSATNGWPEDIVTSASGKLPSGAAPTPNQSPPRNRVTGPGRNAETTTARNKRPAQPASAQASAPSAKTSQKRKRAKKAIPEAPYAFDPSDSESDEDHPNYSGGISVGMGGMGVNSEGRLSHRL
jgi:hypothetical protein